MAGGMAEGCRVPPGRLMEALVHEQPGRMLGIGVASKGRKGIYHRGDGGITEPFERVRILQSRHCNLVREQGHEMGSILHGRRHYGCDDGWCNHPVA